MFNGSTTAEIPLRMPAKMLMLKLKLKAVVNAACETVELRAVVGHDLACLGEKDTHILKIAVRG